MYVYGKHSIPVVVPPFQSIESNWMSKMHFINDIEMHWNQNSSENEERWDLLSVSRVLPVLYMHAVCLCTSLSFIANIFPAHFRIVHAVIALCSFFRVAFFLPICCLSFSFCAEHVLYSIQNALPITEHFKHVRCWCYTASLHIICVLAVLDKTNWDSIGNQFDVRCRS